MRPVLAHFMTHRILATEGRFHATTGMAAAALSYGRELIALTEI